MFEAIWKKILRRRGISLLSIPALMLWILSLGYLVVLHLSRFIQREKIKVGLPVISVGNITVGGTGKTPILSAIAGFLINEGYRVGIVSSAYGRTENVSFVKTGYEVTEMPISKTGDEVMLLADLLPQAVFSINESKLAAAQNAANSKFQLDVLLVDDGFQHWQLHREVDIVTYDAAVPPRQLKIFPHGVLRESADALKRANLIIITRAKFAEDITYLKEKLKKLAAQAEIYLARFQLGELVGQEEKLPLKYLEDKAVFLFAGIGNFRSFEKQIRALTHNLDYTLELSDHQVYTDQILHKIKNLADKYDSEIMLTTGKDWFKIRHFDFGRKLYYLSQKTDLDPGEEKLVSHLLKKVGLKQGVG